MGSDSGSSDFPAFNPAEAGTQFSDSGGMYCKADLTWVVTISKDSLPVDGYKSQK